MTNTPAPAWRMVPVKMTPELYAEFANIDGPWCRGALAPAEVWEILTTAFPAPDLEGIRESAKALSLLADWLTQVQNESDDTDAEKALLRLNGDTIADLARRLSLIFTPEGEGRE